MFVAYILTKSRFWTWKIVNDRKFSVFKKNGLEYKIDPQCMYQKRILGLKAMFVSMYFEGNPNPIGFDILSNQIMVSDVPIDDVALIVRKVMRGIMDIVFIILIGITLVVSIITAVGVYN